MIIHDLRLKLTGVERNLPDVETENIKWMALARCDRGFISLGLTSGGCFAAQCPDAFFYLMPIGWNHIGADYRTAMWEILQDYRRKYTVFGFLREYQKTNELVLIVDCPYSTTNDQFQLLSRFSFEDHDEMLTSVTLRQITRLSGHQDYLAASKQHETLGFSLGEFGDWWMTPKGHWHHPKKDYTLKAPGEKLRYSLPTEDGRVFYFTKCHVYVHQIDVRVKDVYTYPQVATLVPGGVIYDIYPTERFLYIATSGLVKVYDINTYALIKEYKWVDGIRKLLVSEDGLTMCGLTLRQMVVWDID